MSDSDEHRTLVRLFVATGRAHHEATGGVNPQWAEWYSEHLLDDLNQAVGGDMSGSELTEWLVEADRRYRARDHDVSWPKAYASWLLDDRK